MAEKLSLLDESSDSEVELKINKGYADKYNIWRNKEELQKYKDLKKEDDDSESSSESEEEIPEFDEEFFRALSLLKSKDPRIYQKDFVLFKEKEIKKKSKSPKKKPLYMKDYERNLVLEKGGKFSDEDDEDEYHIPAKGPSFFEEQEEAKKSFKEAHKNLDSDDNDDDLLQVRVKNKEEEKEEESDYLKWLKGEEQEISEEAKKDMSYLRSYWNDPKLDENEKFLRDYILNKKYLEKDENEIPTYEEITSGALSDDEKMIEEQEKFEHKYNFRFEEPDEEFIKRYPRTIGDSLRKADNRRKQKREEKVERKRREKEQRKEELKRLKALKRKEIEEKFMKIKEVVGQEDLNLNESDIESDFDPDKHDQKMREMFNDDYYQVEEDEKPEFPYDEELDSENWNEWTRENAIQEENEEVVEENSNKDVADDNEEVSESKANINIKEEFEKEMISACLPRKKARKKSLFAKVISQPKPLYDPDGKSFDEYLDEYYKLDYEDMIGDMPVRYKYRKVIPNDFGLTVDEILTADEKELNRWCSVKKTCQYRNDEEELYDVQAYKKKSQNLFTKKKILASVYAPKDDIEELTNNKVENSLNYDFKSRVNGVQSSSNKNAEHEIKQEESINNYPKESTKEESPNSKNKSRKKKEKKHDILNIKSENKNSDVQYNEKNNESEQNINFAESGSSKEDTINHISNSFKRKRADNENNMLSDGKGTNIDTTHKEKKHAAQTDVHDTQIMGGNSSNVSEKVTKKKKKKKKKKHNQTTTIDSTVHETNKNMSKMPKNKVQQSSQDKVLGISDERLAAYGINPKKFKNKIIWKKF